jgi:hypothetical protein
VKVELNCNGVPAQMQDCAFLEAYFLALEPGIYTLKVAFGPLWTRFKRQRYYGRWFKNEFNLGNIAHIHFVGKRSDGSLEYSIR